MVGGLVGAGVALLLAPKSGKELRKDIKDIASDTRDKIATTVEKGKELYVDSTEAVKNAIRGRQNGVLSRRWRNTGRPHDKHIVKRAHRQRARFFIYPTRYHTITADLSWIPRTVP